MAALAAQLLGQALAELFEPLQLDVVADQRKLGEIEPGRRGIAQLNLASVAPTQLQGQWRCTWDLWLVVPSSDPEQQEQELTELLSDVIAVLDAVQLGLTWDNSERDTHPDNFAAWRLTLTTLT